MECDYRVKYKIGRKSSPAPAQLLALGREGVGAQGGGWGWLTPGVTEMGTVHSADLMLG